MKYKIEICQHHSKIDEFSSDNYKEVEEWFEENYSILYEWGECTYYKYIDDKDVSDLRLEHKQAMTEELVQRPFTNDEKDYIINALIESLSTYMIECPITYSATGEVGYKIGPNATINYHLKLDSDSLAFQKLLYRYNKRLKEWKVL